MPLTSKQPLACGTWPSPLSAADIASSSLRLGQTAVDGDSVYWLEGRPAEAGRSVLMSYSQQHGMQEVLPTDYNIRSRAHEYGGGAYAVEQGLICFVHDGDRQLYLYRHHEAIALTGEENTSYADMIFDTQRQRVICIREQYQSGGDEPVSEIIAVALDGSGIITVLQSGCDFYSNPELSADGRRLCWLQWNHPHMPWDSTELHVADLDDDGGTGHSMLIAGGENESVFQPQWHPDGSLYFVSDRSGYWNLYSHRNGQSRELYPVENEFGLPQWVFGMSTYAIIDDRRLLCSYCDKGIWHLAILHVTDRRLEELDLAYTDFSSIAANRHGAILLAASPWSATEVLYLSDRLASLHVLRHSVGIELDRGDISEPQLISFSSGDNDTAHGFYYPPVNKSYCVPDHEKPPLIVKSHGGPTGAVTTGFDAKIQYWTTRGFAVLNVNYRGSTGYGRAYHEKLNGQWGIVDVEDCIAGASYLADRGLVDKSRLIITGSSAGGFTTLCALTFHDVFAAGASYYGIGDLEALVRDTHKFESRYFDTLVAPYESNESLYRQRSPLHYADRLSCPVIFLQGSEDRVVPPQQARDMVAALEKKNVPVGYIEFEGEQHGFRRAENIQQALESELEFYLTWVKPGQNNS